MSIRINKYLAETTGISRREADELIASNKVTIDGAVARIGQTITDDSQVAVDGKAIQKQQNYQYIMLYKPYGYVSSRAQQDTNPTLYELLPDEYQQLKTVGRLDKDSSGLIILTNDGDFTHRFTHPKFEKEKRYQVTLNKPLDDIAFSSLTKGVHLPDGISKFTIENTEQPRQYLVIMHEGRNRQIRRTFAALNYEVTKLHRIQMGPYNLGSLKPGETCTISAK